MRINNELCNKSKLKGGISIKSLKRFVADRDTGKWKQHWHKHPPTGKKVAIIGSGPAGLTAGYYLTKLGHSVTVFEALKEPGGMMRFGIPDYRLPKNILDIEIREIQEAGVDIKLNTRVSSIDWLFEQDYAAVFLAIGSHLGMKLGVEGENIHGVIDGVTFLRDLASGKKVKVGPSVIVIGGGNTAIDSARTALRLGAGQVRIIYRRSEAEMPASKDETLAAIEEGIKIEFLTSPVKVVERGSNLKLTCIRNKLGENDAGGRRHPIAVRGSEFPLDCDLVIAAAGQRPEIPPGFKLKTGVDKTIEVDFATLTTSRKGVWAGGDAVTRPGSVIQAIASGRRAAISIDSYLGSQGDIDEPLTEVRQIVKSDGMDSTRRTRTVMPCLKPEQRMGNFEEIELGLDEPSVLEESSGCLHCGNDALVRCRYACPAGVDVPLYVNLISRGEYDEALAVIREKVPFPRVLGRICTAPCEAACTECAICMPYCPVSAIKNNNGNGQVFIDEEECVECGCCLRTALCPSSALWQPELTWPRVVRAQFSDPVTFHPSTMVSGRGTEESKTNDVTGRYPRGYVCIAAELGRPGTGTKMRDVEKVAMAILALGVEFEKDNPTFQLVEDRETGRFREDVLDEKVLSAILEFKVPVVKAPEALRILKRVSKEVDTVVTLDIGSMWEPDGSLPAERIAEEAGLRIRPNGKTNLGLGRPRANILEG
jgi:formate dehydrogenase (NADP+) beta subunit